MRTETGTESLVESTAPRASSSEDIFIDPSVLHEETKAQSALTDIYGVPLFTQAYEQSVLRAREENALAQEADWASIFRSIPEGDVYKDTITSTLFKGSQGQIIRGDPLIKERSLWWAYALIIFAVALTGFLAGVWYRKQERRRKKDADISHSYGS